MKTALKRIAFRLLQDINQQPVVAKAPPTESILKMDYDRAEILICGDSWYESHIRVNACAKETDTIDWIHETMSPGDVVFDIGANNGAYSLVIGKHLKGDCQVYAFEPAWFNFMQLNKNVELNHLENCVFPVCLAVADTDGLDWLNYSSREVGSAEHTFGEELDVFDHPFSPVYKQPVASMTVDRLAQCLNVVPNHLKIDVDGIESAIITGAASTLADPRLRSILVELSPSKAKDRQSMEFIEGLGFSVKNIVPRGDAYKELAQANYIFERTSAPPVVKSI